jgi:rRNA maturation RNase YbeY
MSVKFYTEDVSSPKFRRRDIAVWVREVILLEGKVCGVIAFVFCSDSYLLEVNQKFLNHDYFTDIITFDYVENDVISGDIFISTERVLENSVAYGVSFEDELLRVMIHGVLHLIGYKDKAARDKEKMTEKENFYLDVYYQNF